MKDKFIRKPVVFNKESAWHMEILKRVENESNNFSGYVMSILKGHFDIKPALPAPKKEKEQPIEATQITIKSSGIKLKN
jgi:hypothetical protein